MAPFNLNGLNVVQPAQHDSRDLASPFPDFSAHLDLWTNLPFESDEPLASKRTLDQDEDTDSPQDLTPTHSAPPPLDINALLAGVGIDPLLMPTPPPAPVPSLAQLLALHAAHTTYAVLPLPPTTTAPSPSAPPPSKRSRAPKTSSSIDNNAEYLPSSTSEEQTLSATAPATDDKRRRNTAASARFRLKKKEREAALERRAKELEDRVVELERECEGLRRENGWLKGLVVGVTGAGAAQHQQVAAK